MYRYDLTTVQRSLPLELTIDPGFVHHRKIQTILGPKFDIINNQINKLPDDFSVMKNIYEKAFKACLCEILRYEIKKDWGGEQSDHFTSSIHINQKRYTGAFLLKGPASFSPMGLNHLGKNNDQIVRLANEPSQVLFVQHCQEILPAVRSTLRAFAVQPCTPRRYCLIDGKILIEF